MIECSRIDELAREAGTRTSTVRLYQTRGLLPPPEIRGRVGYYGPAHLARLRVIERLQARGYSLAAIKELLENWAQGATLAAVLDPHDELGGELTPGRLRGAVPGRGGRSRGGGPGRTLGLVSFDDSGRVSGCPAGPSSRSGGSSPRTGCRRPARSTSSSG
jgi:DNA-binding transcriptional MerR regulator